MSTPQGSFSIRSILEKEKLNGENFLDWYRNLRIVLKQEKKGYVLEKALGEKPKTNANHAERSAWEKHSGDITDVVCLMLGTMNSDLQKQFEDKESPVEIITTLKNMFQELARTERYNLVKSLVECKMSSGSSVSSHFIKMNGYINNLAKLDCPISQELATDIILQSLPSSYNQFILNYNMKEGTKTLDQLHGMLKTAEPNTKKETHNVLVVKKGKKFKKKGKGKDKAEGVKNSKAPKPKSGPSESDKCHHCNELGHWKRNCKKYLEELKTKKTFKASSSGIYVIEVNVTTYSSNSWVLDTGCGAHICTNMQGLSKSKDLKLGQVDIITCLYLLV
jgi:hypothetical protein